MVAQPVAEGERRLGQQRLGQRHQKQWNGGQQNRSSGAKWWTCRDVNCVAALKTGNRQPCSNKPSADECDVCGTHWDAEKQIRVLQLLAIKKNLKTAKAKAADQPPSLEAGTVEVVLNKQLGGVAVSIDSEEEDAEPATTTLALPDEFVVFARLLLPPASWRRTGRQNPALPGSPRRRLHPAWESFARSSRTSSASCRSNSR